MTIIGVSGYARAGKDTIGNVLVEQHGFTRLSFAQALKDAAYALDPLIDPVGGAGQKRLQKIVDDLGWDDAKDAYPEIRRTLQRMGTEVGRKTFHEDFWVDIALTAAEKDPTGNFVLTDCRFKNEARVLSEMGGYIWRVERPGFEPVNAHPSETDLDDWNFDYIIYNRDGIMELHDWVKQGLDLAAVSGKLA